MIKITSLPSSGKGQAHASLHSPRGGASSRFLSSRGRSPCFVSRSRKTKTKPLLLLQEGGKPTCPRPYPKEVKTKPRHVTAWAKCTPLFHLPEIIKSMPCLQFQESTYPGPPLPHPKGSSPRIFFRSRKVPIPRLPNWGAKPVPPFKYQERVKPMPLLGSRMGPAHVPRTSLEWGQAHAFLHSSGEGQASASCPVAGGAQARTSLSFPRGDHVHASLPSLRRG